MRNIIIMLLTATLLLPTSLIAADAEIEKSDLNTSPGKNYVYKVIPDKPQNLEVYLPPSSSTTAGKVPGVLLIHGGGWSIGNLESFRYACSYFASRGLVAATINYRMWDKGIRPPNESRKRLCVTDAKSALRWFKQHADEWHMDPSRIIIGGGSAGGHIAMAATLNSFDDPGDPKNIDTSVVAYLLFNPAITEEGTDNDSQVDIFKMIRAGMAPAQFQFGSQDKWKVGSDLLIPKLKALGNEATMLIAPGDGHGFYTRTKWMNASLVAADQFLVTHGLLSGTCPLKLPEGGERLQLQP